MRAPFCRLQVPQARPIGPQGPFIGGSEQLPQIAGQPLPVPGQLPPDLDEVGRALRRDAGRDGQALNEDLQLRQLDRKSVV